MRPTWPEWEYIPKQILKTNLNTSPKKKIEEGFGKILKGDFI